MPQPQPQSIRADEPAAGLVAHDTGLAPARRWVAAHCRPGCEEALRTGMETVEILRSLEVDAEGLLAGLLQSLLPVDEREQEMIAGRFGAPTLALLRGAAHMRQLSELARHRDESANPRVNEENLRKMLIAMVDDVRVVLIELARHLAVLLRGARDGAEIRAGLGRMTLDVYAPLANRLGVGQLKWRMEDCALRCLHPADYRHLAARLAETRADRERYIRELTAEVRAALKAAGIAGEVRGRPKHLYGIWKKMRAKGLALENLRDIHAVRILVDSEADCYAALAMTHTNWRPLPGEFDDYIATPKDNGYRSIHSVITGPRGRVVEVQIRTREMHRQSELGVAAHWRYKENLRPDEGIDNKVARLRQLLQWKEELHDTGALADASGGAAERVYVFTPKGTVIDLPAGSTPIDFAYAVHTEIGHRTRGALVNGKMAPLAHRLQTGEQVHIQTAKHGRPSRDWLRGEPGYVRTRRARGRIAHWFKRADYAQHLADGRALLERELSRLGMADLGYDKITRKTHFHKTDDLLAALGAGDFKLSRALAPFRRRDAGADGGEAAVKLRRPRRPPDGKEPRGARFKVDGVGEVLTRMANCCQPIPGDSIIGFITTGRGVSIHRRNCRNLRSLDAPRRARLVEVQWGEAGASALPVELRIAAYHRSGLLHDITQFLKDGKIEVLKLNMETDAEQVAHIQLKLEISGLAQLDRVVSRLAQIPNVLRVRRVAS